MADRSLFNIVVLGAMNPRIHHPHWYRQVGLISQQELEEALHAIDTIATPPLSQFRISSFLIQCQEQRWEIQSSSLEHIDRLTELASHVFDDLLKHTPVSRFGFNYMIWKTVECENVSKRLADILPPASLGLDRTALLAEMKWTIPLNSHQKNIVLRGGETPSQVFISINDDFKPPEEAGFFDMKEKLQSTLPAVREWWEVMERLIRVLEKK
jgi:hypothetical protein